MKKVSIIFGLIVFLVSLFVFSPAIFADTSSINNEVLRTDLSMKVGDSISEEFVDETGEVNKIVVTKVAEEGPTVAFRSSWLYLRNRKASNGTYHIHYYRGVFNCGFYVTINTRNIVRAFDEWHFHTVGVNSASLVHESNKQATVYYQFQLSTPWVGGPSWNGGLRARIDADQLVTYVK